MLPCHGGDGEISAINGNAIPQMYALHERATIKGQLHHFAPGAHGDHRPNMFYDPCKHNPSNVNGLTISIAHRLHNGLGQCRMRMHRF